MHLDKPNLFKYILSKLLKIGIVAQWLGHRSVTAEVAGSSPVSPD